MEPAVLAPLISFCSTCKNRLWQLRRTLPDNLEAIRRDQRSELVLVNYNSADGLDKWIRRYAPEMQSGRLRYVHQRTEPFFHCSKAKNLAHFAAKGEFVVNLDADNFIGETIALMRQIWRNRPNCIIHGFCGDFKDGSYGRIAMLRRSFLALGGYDEEMLPIGHQDRDLLSRARAAGHIVVPIKQSSCPAIRNTIRQKMRYTGTCYSHREMAMLNSKRVDYNRRMKRIVANQDRKPMPVTIDFTVETLI